MQSEAVDRPPSRRRPRHSSSTSSMSAIAAKRPKLDTGNAMAKRPEQHVDLTQPTSAFQPYSGAKKLVIKNVRSASSRDAQVEEYYARTERDLGEALEAVLAGRRPAVPLERLYRGVENVCRRGKAEKVYLMLNERVERHLQKIVLPRIRQFAGSSNIDILQSVLAEWKTWNSQTVGLAIGGPFTNLAAH